MRFASIAVGLALLAVPAGQAVACSVTQEFVRDTSFELVEGADAVVVARAIRQTGDEEDGSTEVVFAIEQSFKGTPPDVVTMGWAQLGTTIPSDPDDLSTAHPESFMGPCTRRTFERGGRYVLFLHQGDGKDEPSGWYPRLSVFWRGAEDYAGPDSLWARVLQYYIEVQAEPDPMVELEVLAARLPALEAPSASAADRQRAMDIRDHLSSLSPSKPTPYLIAAYEALERGESPRFDVRGPEANREGGMADALTDMVFDIHRPEFDMERAKEFVLLSLVNGEHPDATPLFERLVAGAPSPRQLGLAVRFLAKNGQYRRAFELVETDMMRRLGGLSNEAASLLVHDVDLALTGPHWQEDEERELWRSDPYVLSRWPELALSISSDLKRRGVDGGVGPIQLLQTDDPRARPEVTLMMAEDFNEALEAWAIAEVDRLTPTADWLEHDDPLWLPVRALVVGFGEERDAALVRTFCQNESGRIIVLTSLALWGDDLKQELLLQILATPGLDDETVEYVRRALLILDGRTTPARNRLLGHSESYDAVVASLSGQPIKMFDETVAPITCPAA